jgi:hypothetical protein
MNVEANRICFTLISGEKSLLPQKNPCRRLFLQKKRMQILNYHYIIKEEFFDKLGCYSFSNSN